MDREQIIKALECCQGKGCKECPYNCNCATCISTLQGDALALIKELTEENERVTQLLHEELENNRKICEMLDKKAEECERLNASCTELTQCYTKLETLYKIERKRVDTVKADTVRKMQERLKNESDIFNFDTAFGCSLKIIDQIAKEMLEGS